MSARSPDSATCADPFGVRALPHASHVRLEIFDMQGRRVRVLANKVFEPGEHELIWDRRTTNGAIARPGIYFYRIEAGEHRARRRMVVLP